MGPSCCPRQKPQHVYDLVTFSSPACIIIPSVRPVSKIMKRHVKLTLSCIPLKSRNYCVWLITFSTMMTCVSSAFIIFILFRSMKEDELIPNTCTIFLLILHKNTQQSCRKHRLTSHFQHQFKAPAVIRLTYNALNVSDCPKSTFTLSKANICRAQHAVSLADADMR